MSNYSVLGIVLDVLLSQHFSEESTVFNPHLTDDEAEAQQDKLSPQGHTAVKCAQSLYSYGFLLC